MGTDTNRGSRRPQTIDDLERAALVARMRTGAVGPGGAESEPQRVVERAVTNVRLDRGALGAARGVNAMKPVREDVATVDPEDDDPRKAIAADQSPDVELDDPGLDRRAHLRARIENQARKRDRLTRGHGWKRLGRKSRR